MTLHPRDILGESGPVASGLSDGPGYEHRPQQLSMADAVWDAMESRRVQLAEAGTGVGKSFAYLVPAMLRAIQHRETVVVATNTIALQEQLIERDIPFLLSTVDRWGAGEDASDRVVPVLVKGRANYASIRRLRLASSRQDRLFGDEAARRTLHQIEDWAYDTEDGTRSTLPVLERESVWDAVRSDADNCMGRNCPHNRQCYYQTARRAIEGANLLVCNHALFFADLALKIAGTGSSVLPKYDHVILDEAHQIEDVASEHLGGSMTEGRVAFLLRTLYDVQRRKGYLDQLRLVTGDHEGADDAIRLVLDTREAADEYFSGWRELVESGQLPSGRVTEPKMVDNVLSDCLRRLAGTLNRMKEDVREEADKFELNAYARRATDLADTADRFDAMSLPGFAYWVELGRSFRGGQPPVGVAFSPVEVGPFLNEHLFAGEASVTLTSATLATRQNERTDDAAGFGHICERLGCEDADAIQLGSPFEYSSQVELIIDRSVPPSRPGGSTQAYHDALARRVLEHVVATDGGAFVLFTAFSALHAVADRVAQPLEARAIRSLVQGRDGSRAQILDRFRADDRAVLFGAASFWQGVDVRGDTLRNVIITRLPFQPPDRPLTQARLEMIEARGGDPFKDDSLPRAVIRFKQGFGRLIRSHADAGRVVVLDPRIRTSWYGRAFLGALPEGVRVREMSESVHDPAQSWDDTTDQTLPFTDHA